MKKFLFGFILAFSIFLVPRSVSAAIPSLPSQFPSEIDSSIVGYLEELKQNPNFDDFSGRVSVLFTPLQNGGVRALILQVSYTTELPPIQWARDHGYVYAGSYAWVVATPSTLSTVNFSLVPFDSSVEQPNIVKWDNIDHYECGYGYIQDGTYNFTGTDHNLVYLFSFDNEASSLSPDYLEVPVGFDFGVDDFYTWIINNNKLSELPSYIVQSKLKSFLNFYKSFGSSNSFFISKIVDWFNYVSIPNQTLENIRSLKSSTDKLYQEYLNYRSSTHAYWPGATKLQERDSIDTVTNNNNTSLITDDANDDIYTKLLRDILRGVISISNNVVQACSNIVTKLDQLDFTVSVSNNGGVSSTNFDPILNKMDDIIDALGSDTVSVEISQTSKDDTDDFFDDWNLEFSTALNNKFPVASQLSTLFTDFWEKCGVDADGDGETFEYYNPGVLTASVSRSGSAVASESDIVSDFLTNFDDADPAFLDDASFHGVPDLSVTVGGHSVSIIDFRVYAKYREKIHFIISFVIWTLYLLHLYKALPTIIGQVADVSIRLTDD